VLAAYQPDKQLFRDQLVSLRNQTLVDWTCLISADGDPDSVLSQVDDACLHDERFLVIGYNDRQGVFRNFERVLAAVDPCARWVALADQDDVWQAEKLSVLVPHLDHASLVTCQADVVRRTATGDAHDGITRRRVHSLFGLVADNQVSGSFSVLRRELLDVALPFPPSTDVGYHDHWLAVCALAQSGIAVVDEPLQTYVQHGGNVIGERRTSWRVALSASSFGNAGRSLPRRLDYLVAHRLGWRRTMARTLLRRCPDMPDLLRRDLEVFATARAPALLAGLLHACLRREVPVRRALSLALAACWAAVRRTRDRPNDDVLA
jgi:glycosyltransferase involved in cell wall biosynthesis